MKLLLTMNFDENLSKEMDYRDMNFYKTLC